MTVSGLQITNFYFQLQVLHFDKIAGLGSIQTKVQKSKVY